jgi:hypothetical protein
MHQGTLYKRSYYKGLLRSSLDSCKKGAPRMVTPDGIGMYNRKDLPEREICSKIEYARFLSRDA